MCLCVLYRVTVMRGPLTGAVLWLLAPAAHFFQTLWKSISIKKRTSQEEQELVPVGYFPLAVLWGWAKKVIIYAYL